MSIPAVAFALLALPAAAAPVAHWHGPGDRACNGRCSLEWAASKLTPAQRAELAHAMRQGPARHMAVQDGDVLPLMTYYHGGPVADARGVVAVLDAPEPAMGWRLNGWSFVQVTGCQNWAVRLDGVSLASVPEAPPSTGMQAPVSLAIATRLVPDGYTPGRDCAQSLGACRVSGFEGGNVEVLPLAGGETPAPIPPVPAPASMWLALSGLVALLWLRRRA